MKQDIQRLRIMLDAARTKIAMVEKIADRLNPTEYAARLGYWRGQEDALLAAIEIFQEARTSFRNRLMAELTE